MTSPTARTDTGALAPGTIYTLLAAAGFAAVSIFTTKALATGLTLATVLAWRFVIAAAVLSLFVGARNYRRIPPNDMLKFLTIGGFGQALLIFMALSALKYIPAATLAFLFYTYPAWVALTQTVRGAERLDRRRALALALSFGGIGVMVGMPGATAIDWRGVALALGAAMVYGIYIPIMRGLQGDYPVPPTSAYGKIGAAVAFLMMSVGDQSFTYRLSAEAWMTVTGLAVLSTVLPGVFFTMGLVRLGPVRTAIVSTVEPFLTALLAIVVLGQPLTVPTMLGGALVVAAVVVLQFRRERVA